MEKKYQWMKDIPIKKYIYNKKEIKQNKTINELKLKNNSDITVI